VRRFLSNYFDLLFLLLLLRWATSSCVAINGPFRPVGIPSVCTQRQTNPTTEMTPCINVDKMCRETKPPILRRLRRCNRNDVDRGRPGVGPVRRTAGSSTSAYPDPRPQPLRIPAPDARRDGQRALPRSRLRTGPPRPRRCADCFTSTSSVQGRRRLHHVQRKSAAF